MISGCKYDQAVVDSVTKDLTIVDKKNERHNLLFFEVDSYHGMPRVCLLLSTVDMRSIEKKSRGDGKFRKDRIPDDLTQKIFKARMDLQEKHMPKGLFEEAKNSPQVEDARWEDLAMHLEYGVSKSIPFGKANKAHWINLKELQRHAKFYSHAFDAEASQLEDLKDEIQKTKVGFFANMLIATISLAGWGSAAAVMAPVVGGVVIAGGTFFYFEKKTKSRLIEVKKLQGKIARFLPKANLLEENNVERIEGEAEIIEGTDVYKALSQILTNFSQVYASEKDVFRAASARRKLDHKSVTEILMSTPPGVFTDACPKSLLDTATIANMLTQEN